MRLSPVAGMVVLGWSIATAAQEQKPAVSPPPEPAKPPAFTFAMHGFIGGTVFVQDAAMRPGEGGFALWVAPQQTQTTPPTVGNIGGQQPKTDKLILSGDVRQSRFNLSVAGRPLLGFTPKGVLELDFFGGYAGGSAADTSPLPRMRHAYAELGSDANRILFGQTNDLLIAQVPVSLAHLGNPLGFVAGMQGWRRPGVFGFHTLGDRKDRYAELAWEVGRASWNDAMAGHVITSGDRFGFQAGEASGLPAVEARLMVGQGAEHSAFVVGHWNRVDRNGVDSTAPTPTGLDVVVGEAGGKTTLGPVTVLIEGFSGKNLGPIQGAFGQIQPNTAGDVRELGGYGQLGLNFTREISLWGFVGTERLDRSQAIAANFAVLQNTIAYGVLQYRAEGFAVGLEWDHYWTRTRNNVTVGGVRDASLDGVQQANKASLNGIYFF
ncbi:MAG TPA: hypothetical protein VF830_01155 [Gemmatimonadales bacterium]